MALLGGLRKMSGPSRAHELHKLFLKLKHSKLRFGYHRLLILAAMVVHGSIAGFLLLMCETQALASLSCLNRELSQFYLLTQMQEFFQKLDATTNN